MSSPLSLANALAVLISWSTAMDAYGQSYPRLAPYSGIRWNAGEKPEVRVEGEWYALVSINNLGVEQLKEFAKKKYEATWMKRFNEDIVQVLSEMGHTPDKTVTLVVKDLKSGAEKKLDIVPLTSDNRRAIMELQRGPAPAAKAAPVRSLNADDMRQALEIFQANLNERWSYRHANRADFDGACKILHANIERGMTRDQFGIELQKIIAMGIDGHASVSGYRLSKGGCLPFLIEPATDRYVAFRSDRTGFLADGFPYVISLDGKNLAEWMKAAEPLVVKGSPQFVRRHCLRNLREFDYFRDQLGVPRRSTVDVELATATGTARKIVSLNLMSDSPEYGTWPRAHSRILDSNVGYLRLADLRARESVPEIKKWLPEFRDAKGLIIDVRDNSGGDRDALISLYAHFASPNDPPRVFSAAAYRLHKDHNDDHLVRRFMYRADSPQWTVAEQDAVRTFAKQFQPKWIPPAGQFSEWHYLALSRRSDNGVYHFSKPVVVLMNSKCFSATDILLAGLKGLPNVTLLGTPSSGGSALAQRVKLGNTPFELRFGTMISYQADGTLFDGNGVLPDEVADAVPEYYIGGRDHVLERAIQMITAK